MATTLDLPVKRPNEDEEFGPGSGSAQEASKKAKTELSSDCDGPDFDSFKECLEYFGDRATAADYWREYPHRLEKKCRLRDFKFFLKSTGQVDKANSLRTYDDMRKFHYSEDWEMFCARKWRLQPIPGRYDDYQRLFVADGLCSEYFLFCTHKTDVAYLEFYDHLLDTLKVNTSQSFDDVKRVALDMSNEYKIDDLLVLDQAISDSHMWLRNEDLKKEFVPVFTELWKEIIKNERAIDVVVKDITERDKDLYSRCKNYIQLADITRYISVKTKGNSVNDLCPEDLVREYFRKDPPVLKTFPYSDYVKKKIQVAEKLGIIESSAST